MPSRTARKAGNIAHTQAPKPATTCKTCSTCRRKKIKCSGSRPQCMACAESHQPCVYPRDARKDTRPSRVRLLDLEATMSAMIQQIRDAGTMVHQEPHDMEEDEHEGPDLTSVDTPEWTGPELSFPTPTASSTTTHDRFLQSSGRSPEESSEPQHGTSHMEFTSRGTSHGNVSQQPNIAQPDAATGNEQPDSLSPCEARVAGVYHEDGCVSSVHGLAGIMNPTRRAFHKENISKVSRKGEAAVAGSKARLISNAILQKQREGRLFKQPQQSIDLDGCDPELARHLIDVHFNGNYPACMATYRPAILESIACNGPWVNKLLLNAMFYSSSLQSDRKSVLGSSEDPQSVRSRFHNRFSQLLGQALGNSSIPTATALLLVSSTLLSEGKSSAAWNLSGTAYRMVVDLGCHMMLGPDYEEVKFQSTSQMLHKDIEQESRKRLYWTAYVTDVTQSLCLGRQCSFATTEARVPLMFLDTFEELNEWEPYRDPTDPASTSKAYVSQSAYAVSSFIALVKLMRIGAQVTRLYGIETVGQTTETIMREKHSIESQLTHWLDTIPEELMFNSGNNNAVPPPHQIVPYTTYHTFRILLHRALTEEGHLRRHTDPDAKRVSEQECIASALAIENYVQAYRKTFSLRRAPFLLCYAVYSAVAIILPQERHDRGNFTSIIAFFWTCLGELQQGCNLGLKKPLSVLRNMAREFELSSKELGSSAVAGPARAQQDQLPRFDLGTLDGSCFPQLPLTTQNLDQQPFADAQYLSDFAMQSGAGQFGTEAAFGLPGSSDFLNDQEWCISQNTLYGLFAPFPQ